MVAKTEKSTKSRSTQSRKPKSAKPEDIAHAKGVYAAALLGGIQLVGTKNLESAKKTLVSCSELPGEFNLQKITTSAVNRIYAIRKPVVGDRFMNAKGFGIEITEIKKRKQFNSTTGEFEEKQGLELTYREIGRQKGKVHWGSIYLD